MKSALATCFSQIELAHWPFTPPLSNAQRVDEFRSAPRSANPQRWVARSADGTVVGLIMLAADIDRLTGSLWWHVVKSARRRGVGSRLLTLAVATAESLGLETLNSRTTSAAPEGHVVAKQLKGELSSQVFSHAMSVKDVKPEVLTSWIQGGMRASCSLRTSCGRYDERDIRSVARLRKLVADSYHAPDVPDAVRIQTLRAEERRFDERGIKRWTVYADSSDGAVIGISEASWDPAVPAVLGYDTTAVEPAYQGRGLAHAMTAKTWLDVIAARPSAEYIRGATLPGGFGVSLAAAGYGVHRVDSLWVFQVANVREYLQRHEVESRSSIGKSESHF